MTAAACRSSECERARTFFGGGEKPLLRTRSKRESELYNFFGGEFAGFGDFFSHPQKNHSSASPAVRRGSCFSGAGSHFLIQALGLANQVVAPPISGIVPPGRRGRYSTPCQSSPQFAQKIDLEFDRFSARLSSSMFRRHIRLSKSATFHRAFARNPFLRRRQIRLETFNGPQIRHVQSRPRVVRSQSQFCAVEKSPQNCSLLQRHRPMRSQSA